MSSKNFVTFEVEGEGKAKVKLIHYFPEMLSDDELQEGILVDKSLFFDAENIPYKTAVLYINPDTHNMWYEYVDRPLTSEEKIELQQSQIEEMTIMFGDMMLGGM